MKKQEKKKKKAERQKIDAFELWCWIRLLRVPWTARRSNQSILKESVLGDHWKAWCWSWNSNTLATWCEELTHLKRPWYWERWGQEEKGTIGDEMVGWHHRLNGHGFGWTPGVGDGQGGLVATIHGVAKSQTWLSDWTELNRIYNSSKSTMNYDLFLLITVKQKWQFLMVHQTLYLSDLGP